MDNIYLYPKSSCYTAECKQEYPVGRPDAVKTNMSVEDCKRSEYFDCYYKATLKSELQPREVRRPDGSWNNVQGWSSLNPEVITNKLSRDFNKVPCFVCPDTGAPQYISRDPRLFSSTRADYTVLDRPPINGKVKLADVYNSNLDGYGRGFVPYEKIGDGQIEYYIDKSIAGAFYKPVFSEPAEETLVLFQDPMGAMKPEANRRALVNTANPLITRPVSYPYCLSSLQDSQSHREDLMALQQRKNNQQKWTVRWT